MKVANLEGNIKLSLLIALIFGLVVTGFLLVVLYDRDNPDQIEALAQNPDTVAVLTAPDPQPTPVDTAPDDVTPAPDEPTPDPQPTPVDTAPDVIPEPDEPASDTQTTPADTVPDATPEPDEPASNTQTTPADTVPDDTPEPDEPASDTQTTPADTVPDATPEPNRPSRPAPDPQPAPVDTAPDATPEPDEPTSDTQTAPVDTVPDGTSAPNTQTAPVDTVPDGTSVPNTQTAPVDTVPDVTSVPNTQTAPVDTVPDGTSVPNTQTAPVDTVPDVTSVPNTQTVPVDTVPDVTSVPNTQTVPVDTVPDGPSAPSAPNAPVDTVPDPPQIDNPVGGEASPVGGEGGQDCDGTQIWAGNVPTCLSPGDSYRIIFVTSDRRDATSSNIGTYNNFVQTQANLNPDLVGITFRALASTDATNARTNTDTFGAGTNIRIFYYQGRKVADDYANLYGTWDTNEPRNQNGEIHPGITGTGEVRVWTGTRQNGTSPAQELGTGAAVRGDARNAGQTLNVGTALGGNNFAFFYALSDIQTVPVTALPVIPVNTQSGRQDVYTGTEATLDGSGSSTPDASASIETYTWTQIGATATTHSVTLDTTNPAMPTFIAPAVTAPTNLEFSLTVTDTNGAVSAPFAVTILVNPRPRLVISTEPASPNEGSGAIRIVFTVDPNGGPTPNLPSLNSFRPTLSFEGATSADDFDFSVPDTFVAGGPADYQGESPQIELDPDLSPGDVAGFINLVIEDDALAEITAGCAAGDTSIPASADNCITLLHTNAEGSGNDGTVGGTSGNLFLPTDPLVVSISDDADSILRITGDSRVLEGDTATFTISLPEGVTPAQTLELMWEVICSDTSANASENDFAGGTCPSGSVSIAISTTSAIILVTPILDVIEEGDEQFIIRTSLAGLPEGFTGPEDFTVTILGAIPIKITAQEESGFEGGFAEFRVSFPSGRSVNEDLSVTWEVECGSGSGITAADFVGAACPVGSVTIAANTETSAIFRIITVDDALLESAETVIVRLTMTDPMTLNGNTLNLADTAEYSILNRDLGVISISVVEPSTVPEGASVTFNVSLTDNSNNPLIADRDIGITWELDSTRQCGSDNAVGITPDDFIGDLCDGGIVTIPAGTTSGTLVVEIANDDDQEGPEVFAVLITSATGLGAADSGFDESLSISPRNTAFLTVTTNDQIPTIRALSDSIIEGETAQFVVSLRYPNPEELVDTLMVGCLADDPGLTETDLLDPTVCQSNSLTIPPGTTNISISIETVDDLIEEFTPRGEALTIMLGTGDSATVRVIDNDGIKASFTDTNVRVDEGAGNPLIFEVRLGGDPGGGRTASVDYIIEPSTLDGDIPATEGTDYSHPATIGTLTFPPGTDRQFIEVIVIDDSVLDTGFAESIRVRLVNSVNVVLDDPVEAIGTIADDDQLRLGFRNNMYESDEDEGQVLTEVGILEGAIESGPSDISISFNTNDGTAVAGEDYEGVNRTLTFSEGVTSLTVPVTLLNDNKAELPEEFSAILDPVTVRPNVIISLRRSDILIHDTNDAVLLITTAVSNTVREGETIAFRVGLPPGISSDEELSVQWAVDCSGSITPGDFVGGCPSGSVSISSGTTSGTVIVPIAFGGEEVTDEVFTINLLADGLPTGFTIDEDAGSATATIDKHMCIDYDGLSFGIPFSECLFLVELYEATDGVNWVTRTGWEQFDSETPLESPVPVSGWHGVTVTVDADNIPHVTGIELQGNGLTGEIPSSVGEPLYIGNLLTLETINLGGNDLSGEIPSSIGNLLTLETIDFGGNDLSGEIPSAIGNLLNLGTLNLRDNDLSGEIPSSIGDLLNLETINIESNNLSGAVPSTIGNLLNIRTLRLADNSQLGGSIPYHICEKPGLDFSTDGTSITCEAASTFVPDWEVDQRGVLNGALVIVGDSVLVRGSDAVPSALITAEFIDETTNVIAALVTVAVSSVESSSPGAWSLEALDLPEGFYTLNVRQSLYPDEFGVYQLIGLMRNVDNRLQLAPTLCRLVDDGTTVFGVAISECEALVELYQSTDGPNWDVRQGWDQIDSVTGQISDISTWSGVSVRTDAVGIHRVIGLDLSANTLNGALPDSINNLLVLRELNLSNNSLRGELPYIGNLLNIEVLNLANNPQLTGTIPYHICEKPGINVNTQGSGVSCNNDPSSFIPDWNIEGEDGSARFFIFDSDRLPIITVAGQDAIPGATITARLLNGDGIPLFTVETIAAAATTQSPGSWSVVIPENLQTQGQIYGLSVVQSLYPPPDGGNPQLTSRGRDGDRIVLNTFCRDNTDAVTGRVTGVPLAECRALVSFYFETGGFIGVDDTGTIWDSSARSGWESITDSSQVIRITEWNGITSEVIGGGRSITELDIPDSNIRGVIPPSISNLTNLKLLNLSDNSINGIPSNIGSLINLETLDISRNSFVGEIPSSIGNLENLEELNISENGFEGEIPSTIGGLVEIETLDLSGNVLEGEIPSSIGRLVNLEFLDLSFNGLSGNVPADIGNLINLINLDLSVNSLVGSIPYHICAKRDAGLLSLNIEGTTPTLSPICETDASSLNIRWEPVGLSPDAEGVYRIDEFPVIITGNGAIPGATIIAEIEDAFDVFAVHTVDADSVFTDAPGSWRLNIPTLPDGLYTVNVRQALYPIPTGDGEFAVSGEPVEVNNRFRVIGLCGDPSRTDLIFGVPRSECAALLNLFFLSDGNELWTNTEGWDTTFTRDISATVAPVANWHGVTVEEVNGVPHVVGLQLPNNGIVISTDIAFDILSNLEFLRDLDLSTNTLSGAISGLSSLTTSLETLNLANTSISGEIPLGIRSLAALTLLDLSGNNITGDLPEGLSDLINLEEVNLSDNRTLSGALSLNLPELDALRVLNLDNTVILLPPLADLLGDVTVSARTTLRTLRLSGGGRFSGQTIPDSLEDFSGLEVLAFAESGLTGMVPQPLETLSNLRIIDFSDNSLTGEVLPASWFRQLRQLEELNLSRNDFTGRIASSIQDLTQIRILDISDNRVSDIIPTAILQLGNLQILKLNNNNIRGSIPAGIGELASLTELDLSRNPELNGTIPESIGNLLRLEILRLASNNLVGSPPESFRNLINLETLHVSGNANLEGTLPYHICNKPGLDLDITPSDSVTCSGIEDFDLPEWVAQGAELIDGTLQVSGLDTIVITGTAAVPTARITARVTDEDGNVTNQSPYSAFANPFDTTSGAPGDWEVTLSGLTPFTTYRIDVSQGLYPDEEGNPQVTGRDTTDEVRLIQLINYGFEQAVYSFSEGSGDSEETSILELFVVLSSPSASEVIINHVVITGATATLGLDEDYIITEEPIVFRPGETRKGLRFAIRPDRILEPDESFSVALSTDIRGLTPENAVARVNIEDDEIGIGFDITEYEIEERNTSITLSIVILTNPERASELPRTLAVNVNTIDEDRGDEIVATANEDFVPISTVIPISANTVEGSVTVRILSDSIPEGSETILVQLTIDDEATSIVNTNSTARITILDDEPLDRVISIRVDDEQHRARRYDEQTGEPTNEIADFVSFHSDGTPYSPYFVLEDDRGAPPFFRHIPSTIQFDLVLDEPFRDTATITWEIECVRATDADFEFEGESLCGRTGQTDLDANTRRSPNFIGDVTARIDGFAEGNQILIVRITDVSLGTVEIDPENNEIPVIVVDSNIEALEIVLPDDNLQEGEDTITFPSMGSIRASFLTDSNAFENMELFVRIRCGTDETATSSEDFALIDDACPQTGFHVSTIAVTLENVINLPNVRNSADLVAINPSDIFQLASLDDTVSDTGEAFYLDFGGFFTTQFRQGDMIRDASAFTTNLLPVPVHDGEERMPAEIGDDGIGLYSQRFTINDEDRALNVTRLSTELNEGETARFQVSVTGGNLPISQRTERLEFQWYLECDTALNADFGNFDFTPCGSGNAADAVILPGQASTTIDIPTNDETLPEGNEIFRMVIINPAPTTLPSYSGNDTSHLSIGTGTSEDVLIRTNDLIRVGFDRTEEYRPNEDTSSFTPFVTVEVLEGPIGNLPSQSDTITLQLRFFDLGTEDSATIGEDYGTLGSRTIPVQTVQLSGSNRSVDRP